MRSKIENSTRDELLELLNPFKDTTLRIKIEDINNNTLLEELGLDSLQMLELFVLIHKRFKVKLKMNRNLGKDLLKFENLLEFIEKNRTI